jgi:hypothetical protein
MAAVRRGVKGMHGEGGSVDLVGRLRESGGGWQRGSRH